MNRNIHFRVWSKTTKLMLKVSTITFCSGSEYGFKKALAHDEKNLYYFFNDEDTVLMQFTGLKDKNGKEIYEGDIIKTEKDWTENQEIFEIKYMELNNCGDCTLDSGIGFNFYLNETSEMQIIGNVFQNPELLEKEKTND